MPMEAVDKLVENLLSGPNRYLKGDRLVLSKGGDTWSGVVKMVTRKLGWPSDLITMEGSWDGGPNVNASILEVFSDDPGIRVAPH